LRLRQIEPWIFVVKLLILLALTATSAIGIMLADYPLKILFQVLMGAALAHATELVHQCIHRTAIGKRRWDNVLGRILGLPSGTSFYYYRWFHLWHHRHNGTELDRESFDYTYQLMGDGSRRIRFIGILRHLSMLGHYKNTLSRIFAAARGRLVHDLTQSYPEMKASAARKIEQDYQLMGILLLLVLLLSLVFNTTIFISLWLVPLLIGWAPIHALVELPEHWHCARPEANVFLNTRSIDASSLTRWFTNNNCNHVGHHLDMSIPLEKLPLFEKALARNYNFQHQEASYAAFYLRFFSFIWKGEGRTQSLQTVTE
jgi:fatty acid desaturase